jgi:ribulose-bisphosphate carboxylase large chain
MLSSQDIPGFFAERSELNLEDYVLLKYLFETDQDPRLAAAALCSEQSTAQWKRPGREEDFRPRFGAKVVELKKVPSPLSLVLGLGTKDQGPATKDYYEVIIAHPHRNFGPRIPNLLSAAAGEGPFYCPGIQTIKWLDLDLPVGFLQSFDGPQFGLKGLREQLKVFERPFWIGVVKPNIGLAPKEFAEIAYQSWLGGLDIAKDDEMLGDMDWSPLSERAAAAAGEAKAEEETGHSKMYLASITDEVDQLSRLHDQALKGGANAVMVNGIFTGFSALRVLRRHSQLPIMSHFTGTAAFSRHPDFGISSLVATKIQRLAGADMIGLAGFGERMKCPDQEVLDNIRACIEPWGPIAPALPIPGGSDWAGTLPKVYGKIGHVDFGFISGRGIFGHPQGPEAGAKSLHEAWEATQKNIPLSDYAKKGHDALRGALAAFG